MSSFWNNVNKFPKFLITVIIGFFLTTVYPIFKLLKNKKKRIFLIIIFCVFLFTIYTILRLMLGVEQ